MKGNRILAIAIEGYENGKLNNLKNCFSDVKQILDVLTAKYVFDDVEFIYEKQDTGRKNLYRRLMEYFTHSMPEDNILLVFAGHGEYNDELGTAYWQPSDADPEDPSSWINISDLLAFIKVSKALHVSVISDSCFAGAIFEPSKRGGGLGALTGKKSREALTSGGLERVSDGNDGERSPFAETVIKVLGENEKGELLFNAFSNTVILEFDTSKKQTPRFGSLSAVGHEGGTFVFKLKETGEEVKKIGDKNQYLREKMRNLFIPLPKENLEFIEQILKIKEEKSIVVGKQRYEEAVRLRETEKSLEDASKKQLEKYIGEVGKVDFTDEEINSSKQLDSAVENYFNKLEETKTQLEKHLAQAHKELVTIEEEEATFVTAGVGITRINDFADLLSKRDNPALKAFNDNRQKFIKIYEYSILELYKEFKQFLGISNNSILQEKLGSLKEILLVICFHELDILIGRKNEYIEEKLSKNQIEIDILNWLKG